MLERYISIEVGQYGHYGHNGQISKGKIIFVGAEGGVQFWQKGSPIH